MILKENMKMYLFYVYVMSCQCHYTINDFGWGYYHDLSTPDIWLSPRPSAEMIIKSLGLINMAEVIIRSLGLINRGILTEIQSHQSEVRDIFFFFLTVIVITNTFSVSWPTLQVMKKTEDFYLHLVQNLSFNFNFVVIF